MSDLSKERVLSDKAPFANVGVDYFDPLDVRRGRTVLKRYGVIFFFYLFEQLRYSPGGGSFPRHRLLH